MYNLYIEEKKKFLQSQREKEDFKRTQMFNKQQTERKKLINNYSERVKNFILEMAKDSSKVKVKDFKGPIENCRIKYLEETNDKIKGKRGFLFGSFKSEKDRIKDALEQNKYLFGSSNLIDFDATINQQGMIPPEDYKFPLSNNAKANQAAGLIDKGAYYKQPEMRFKPRTDLERIKESISQQKFLNENYNSIVSRQLKQLDLNIFHKIILENEDMKENKEEDENDPANFVISTAKSPEKNPQKAKSKSKVFFKKSINSEAKKIFPEFHYKTHFKAAEAVTISLAQERELKKSNSHYFRPSAISAKNVIAYEQLKCHKPKKNVSMDCLFNDDLYTKNQNPYRALKEGKYDYVNLQQLKQIAFNPSDSTRGKDNENEENRYHDDEKIRIDNESYSINYQLDLIASKILNKCNVHHSKKSSTVKPREGKLMMTNGMTIREFEAKFHL